MSYRAKSPWPRILPYHLAGGDEIGQGDGIGKAASNSTSPKSARRRRPRRGVAATGGGGSVLSGRRCFVTFVSSRPACRWRDNQSPPSLGKRKTKRKREKEGSGTGGREGRGCERRSEVKPRGFPTLYMRVASLCRSSGESERQNCRLKCFFRDPLPSYCYSLIFRKIKI